MKYLSFIALAGLLLTATPAFAMEHPSGERPFGAHTQQFGTPQERCEAGQERLTSRMADAAAKRAENQSRFSEKSEKLETLADEADAAGLDSSALRSAIDTLKSLGAKIDADVEAVIAFQNGLLSVDCATATKEDHAAKREEGKAIHEALHSDIKAVRDHVKNVLQPEIKDLMSTLHPKQ